jgi:hypothetical protein
VIVDALVMGPSSEILHNRYRSGPMRMSGSTRGGNALNDENEVMGQF